MKAIRFHEIGRPEVLKLEEVEDPEAGAGEALVKVHAVGVNFADTLLRRGAYLRSPKLPEIPGFEAAGEVVAVGDGVDRSLVGRRVAFLGEHAYAEYARVPAGQVIPLPEQLSFDEGAAFPLQGLTAYHMLYTADRIEPGGIDAQVDVGHESAQEDDAIAALDVLPDVVTAHRPFINAEVTGMLLTDDRFAEDGGGDRDVGLMHQFEHGVLQAEAVDFDVGNDHWLASGVDHLLGFGEGGAEALAIAALV